MPAFSFQKDPFGQAVDSAAPQIPGLLGMVERGFGPSTPGGAATMNPLLTGGAPPAQNNPTAFGQALMGFLGGDPSFSVMDPNAAAMGKAHDRGTLAGLLASVNPAMATRSVVPKLMEGVQGLNMEGFLQRLGTAHPNVGMMLGETPQGSVRLASIANREGVPRGTAAGQAALADIGHWADANGKVVELTAIPQGTMPTKKLVEIYKRHGFVEAEYQPFDPDFGVRMIRYPGGKRGTVEQAGKEKSGRQVEGGISGGTSELRQPVQPVQEPGGVRDVRQGMDQFSTQSDGLAAARKQNYPLIGSVGGKSYWFYPPSRKNPQGYVRERPTGARDDEQR